MTRLASLTITIACAAAASFAVLVAQAQTPAGAHSARTARVGEAATAAHRRVVTDGQGNVNAAGGGGFVTATGSQGQRSARFTRSADGSASGEGQTTVTNARTGVTYDGTTSYSKGSGVTRTASCQDAAGNTVACGAR